MWSRVVEELPCGSETVALSLWDLLMCLDAGMEAVRSENAPMVCGNLEVEKESELILGPAGENLLWAGF